MTTENDNPNARRPAPANAHAQYHAALVARRKHLAVAYFLLICAGIFGGHKWYLNDRASARTYLCMTAIPLATVMIGWLFSLPMIGNNTASVIFIILANVFGVFAVASLFSLIIVPICLVIDIFDMPAETSKRNLAIQKEFAVELQTKLESIQQP